MKIKQRKYSDHKARRQKRKDIRKSILCGPFCVIQYPFIALQKEGQRKGENKEYFSTLNKDSEFSSIKGPLGNKLEDNNNKQKHLSIHH